MSNWNLEAQARAKWDKRFMQMAHLVKMWSKDERWVGATLVNSERRVVGLGYNGFPKGVNDDKRLQDKETKRFLSVHAELNCILNAAEKPVGCTMFVTRHPCVECAKAIVQAGITRVVSPKAEVNHEVWGMSQKIASLILFEAGIEHTEQA